jgi:hypothetical protein
VIRFVVAGDGREILAETRGYGVYLDNDSLIELAKRSAPRRRRFVDALRVKGTLLFSWANAVEISGPQGDSADAVRVFLDSIGPHWVPLESNAWKVEKKEQSERPTRAAVSEQFMGAYFEERSGELFPKGGRVADLPSEGFFQLGGVLNWVHENRDVVRRYGPELDTALRRRLEHLRTEYDRDATSLDRLLPPRPFDQHHPATFVLVHLQRLLVRESRAYQFMRNDGLDFCHAVIAASYGSVITLDRHWKRRVQSLPCADQLAHAYYRPELDEMVGLLESLPPP